MTPTKVIVAGASGLIGQALTESLRADGVRVVKLVRRPARNTDEIEWLTNDRSLNPTALAGAQAVVNLNGASIAKLPWTAAYRKTLLSSRLTPTRALAEALRSLGDDAPHFVSASAVGFYGDRPGEQLTGPVPATATEIGRELARAMHRPFLLPAPAWALRVGLGRQAADALLLADARLTPDALDASGFTFLHGTASAAIAAAIAAALNI